MDTFFEALEARRVLATFLVSSLADSGPGTFRQAVLDANGASGADEIHFGLGLEGVIPLETDVQIHESLTVTGPLEGEIRLQGAAAAAALAFAPNVTGTLSNLTIEHPLGSLAIINAGSLTVNNVTFINSISVAAIVSTGPLALDGCTFQGDNQPSTNGVAVFSVADTVVSNCTFMGNASGGDHASSIFVDDADLTVTHSTFTNNWSTGGAGAIKCTSNTTIADSTFTDNTGGEAGAIWATGTLTVIRTEFSRNYAAAPGGYGGGVRSDSSATIVDCTFDANEATGGGAIAVLGTLVVESSTLTDNSATMGAGILIRGTTSDVTVVNSTISANIASEFAGGIFNCPGNSLAVDNSTIVYNDGANEGGGILNQGECTLRSTIVFGNTATAGDDISGQLAPGSVANLIGDPLSAGGLMDGVDGNLVGFDPLLGPLQDNGGPTFTHELLEGSPAIDAGTNPGSLSFDQRGSGFPREINVIDIGAVEVGTVEGGGGGGGGGGSAGFVYVDSFTLSRLEFARGDNVTLTGTVPTDGQSLVDQVNFYLDADHDGFADYNELIGSAALGSDGNYSFTFSQTVGMILGDVTFIAVAMRTNGARTPSIDASATIRNAPPTIAALTPSAEELVQGAGALTLAAVTGDVDGFVRSVRFYADFNGNGVGDPDELLGIDNDRTDGFSWTIDAQKTLELPLGRVTFLSVAYDSTAGVSIPRLGAATLLFSTAAGTGHGVIGTADAADKTNVTTVTSAGHVLIFEEGWGVADLQALTGAPAAIGDAVIWHDLNDAKIYVAAPSTHGLLLFVRAHDGKWSYRNLSAEAGAPYSPTHALTVFTSVKRVVVVAGLSESGRIVAFEQTFASPSGPPTYAYRDISGDLESQGMKTPKLESLISYVTSWDSWHIAGIDTDGRIQSVWLNRHVAGFTKWRVDDLSSTTGAPAIQGQLAATLTTWGGINLTGLSADGQLLTTWWVPEFAGEWRVNNLTEQFGGTRLAAGNVSGYTTPWGGLNYVGLDEGGQVIVYWWAPAATDWSVTPLLPDTSPTENRPAGALTSSTSDTGTLNVYGATADGDVIRMSWEPGETDTWRAENLTEMAARQ